MEVKRIILEQLATNDFFKGGFLLTIMAGIGMYLKNFLPWLKERILRVISYSVTIESKTEMYAIFNKWLLETHPDKFKQVTLSIDDVYPNDPQPEKDFKIKEQNLNSSFIFYFKRTPIFLKSQREKLENASYLVGMHLESYVLTTYFSKYKIKELLNYIVELEKQKVKEQNRSSLNDYSNYGWNKIKEVYTKPFDKIFNSEKSVLLDDIKNFYNSREKYQERGIPFRRGYLLSGAPGNSKTTTVLALADKLKKDVYNLNLSSIKDDSDLKIAFSQLKADSFLLLEDIDCVVNGREKLTEKLNFSTLLNVLDGAFSKDNIITFFTTNHIEKLDPAMLREGRIDLKIEFKNPTQKDVEDMIKTFYNKSVCLDGYQSIYSGAQLQEIFIKSKDENEALNKIMNYKKQK